MPSGRKGKYDRGLVIALLRDYSGDHSICGTRNQIRVNCVQMCKSSALFLYSSDRIYKS